MQRALVTGANGFIGAALTLRLLAEGVRVRAVCRSPHKGAALAEAGAEVVAGDVQDAAGLTRLARGCDVVYGVAAVIGGAAYSYNVNILGALNTAQAAREAGAARLVHVSTVAVYGYDISGRIDESYPQRPSRDDYYMQSKSIGEAAVWDYARKTGLPTTVVRPAFVYGPGSTFWSRRLYELCTRLGMPLVNGGRGNAHPIFIDDLTSLLIVLADHPNALGHAFHAAPDPAPTWADFLGYYARMAGNPCTVALPTGALRALSPLITFATRFGKRPFDLAGTLRFWGHDATFSMARAAELLGWRPGVSLQEGMGLTEPWLKAAAAQT